MAEQYRTGSDLPTTGGAGSSGIPHMVLAQTPHYTNKLQRSTCLDDMLAATANAFRVCKSDQAALKFKVYGGRIEIGGTKYTYSGVEGTPLLTNNLLNYVYLTMANIIAGNAVTANTTGWPTSGFYLPLATIACGTSGTDQIPGSYHWDDITDCRGWFCFRPVGETALARYQLPLTDSPGDFTIVDGGWGSGTLTLEGPAVRNTTMVSEKRFEFTLRPEYVADQDVKFTVHAKYDDSGGGTAGTCTVDIEVYKMGDDGTASADLCATAAIALTGSFADKTFTITDTNLAPGDRLRGFVRTSIQETADGGDVKAVIGSMEFQLDIKG